VGITGSLFVYKNINATGIGTVTLSPIGTGTVITNPSTQGSMNNIEIGAITPRNSVFVTTTATSMYATTATVTGAIAATSTSTGALTVPNGGISTHGSIYSQDGNPEENYLLYTPRVSINATAPPGARVGDFWINLNTLAEYQYINDNGNKIWVQIAQL
jgi:hypothetical protein